MRLYHYFPRGRQVISSAFGIVMLGVVWLIFAPIQVGGLASYVTVSGSSMEPNFHLGDLVVTHKESQYQAGDAVVYRNPELEGFVFHRIVAEQLGHLTLQGDNNSWVDHYEPTEDEIIGRLWIHIPSGGKYMQKVRSPFTMAVLAGVLGYFVSTSFFSKKAKGRNRMKNTSLQEQLASIRNTARSWLAHVNSPDEHGSSNINQGSLLEGSLLVLGLVALLSIFLGIISFSRPTSRPASNELPYQHLGVFSYLAGAPQGVYDSNSLKSGDPVFPSLTCTVDMNFQYTFIAQGTEDIAGTYQLTAVLREKSSGWHREIPLQDKTSFTGATFGTTTKLDFCQVQSMVSSMEEQTSFHPGSYTLSISPRVNLNGSLSGHPLDTSFDSGIIFLYDRSHFYVSQDEANDGPLSVTETGAIQLNQSEVNTVIFLGRKLPIPMLRWMTIIGLLGSLVGFVFLGLKLQALSRTEPDQFFRVKYDSLIVDVQGEVHFLDSNCIEVISMDALAKLAERFATAILHVQQDGLHQYFVQAAGATYRFQLMDRIARSTVLIGDATVAGVENDL